MAYPPSTPHQRSSRHRQGIYINGSILGERRIALHLLEEQRDTILHQLQTLIGKKQGEREQEAERTGVVQSLCSNGKMAERTAARLQKGKQQLLQKRTELSQRRATLDALFEQLKRERLRSTTYLFPNDLRTHEMALLHARLGLAADQRLKLRQLLDVLPLTVTGMGKSYAPNAAGLGNDAGCGHGGVAIAICGLRLPEKLALDTLQQEPAQQVALSASLGYMLLLSELLAAYIGGPVLHEGSFQGSTTVLWQQQSFWDRRPSSSHEVLPLFVEKGLSVLGAALGAATGSTAEAQTAKSSSSGWGPLSLLRRVSSNPSPPMPPSSSSPPQRHSGSLLHSSGLQQQQNWQQQWQWHQWPYRPPQGVEAEVQAHAQAKHANLDLAFNMLQRSASSLVHDKACDLGLTLPSSWGPFGWLVMLCAALVQGNESPHPRLGGVLSAAAGCVQSEHAFAQQQRVQQEHAAQHYHVHKQRQQQQQQQQQRALQQLNRHQASKLQSPSSHHPATAISLPPTPHHQQPLTNIPSLTSTHHPSTPQSPLPQQLKQHHYHQQQQQQQQQPRTSASGSASQAAAPLLTHVPQTHPPSLTPTVSSDTKSRGGNSISAGSETSPTSVGTAGVHMLQGKGSTHHTPLCPSPTKVQHPHHSGSDTTGAVVWSAVHGALDTRAPLPPAPPAHAASSGQHRGSAVSGAFNSGAAAAADIAGSGQQPLTDDQPVHSAPQGWGVSGGGSQGVDTTEDVTYSSPQGPALAHPRHAGGRSVGGSVHAHMRVPGTSSHIQQQHQEGSSSTKMGAARWAQQQQQQQQQDGIGPEEEEEGGWEEVGHQHILPPPPSAEEDVLQYVRALYGDGNTDKPPS